MLSAPELSFNNEKKVGYDSPHAVKSPNPTRSCSAFRALVFSAGYREYRF